MLDRLLSTLTVAMLQCADPTQYRDLVSWDCLAQCDDSQASIQITRSTFQNSYFRYCRSTLLLSYFIAFSYFVDPTSTLDIELGTYDYPFRMLDDPFREVFNNFIDLSPTITVNLKEGTNSTLFIKNMPLLLYNTNLKIQPYSVDPSANMSLVSVGVTMVSSAYTRSASLFNPTLSETGNMITYNFTRWTDIISIPTAFISTIKYKFYAWGSSISANFIKFYDIVVTDQNQLNSLFYSGSTLYESLEVRNCSFFLITPHIYNQLGWNQVWDSNYFDITRQLAFSAANIGYSDCSQIKDYTMSNQYVWKNNHFVGVNTVRTLFIAFGQNLNVTFTGNRFDNMRWPANTLGTIYVPNNQYFCGPTYNFFIFDNNTIVNSVPTQSNFGVSMNYLATFDHSLLITFRGNTFINQTFGATNLALLQIRKGGNKDAKVVIEDNIFENIRNQNEMSLIQIRGQETQIKNITIRNAQLSHGIQFTSSLASIKDVRMIQVSSLASSSTNYAFLSAETASNMVIQNFSISNSAFGVNRALSFSGSSNVTVTDLSITDSSVSGNHILYFSQTKDFTFNNLAITGISKTQVDVLPALKFESLTPWATSGQNQLTQFIKVRFANAQVPFFNLASIIDLGNSNLLDIQFTDLTIDNVTLTAQQSLFYLDQIIYTNLKTVINSCSITNTKLDKGSFFELNHNSKEFSLNNCVISNNEGFFSEMNPVELFDRVNKQYFYIKNSQFAQHNAMTQGLFHVSSNAYLLVTDSSFNQIYSTGRGSVVFAEKKFGLARFTNSNFTNNYAYQGGVFFIQLDFMTELINCNFLGNFAVVGGVMYLQNDGSAVFTNSTFVSNLALKSSLFQIYNSQNTLSVSGGKLNNNGYYRSDKLSDVALYNFANQTDSIAKLSQYFSLSFINFLITVLDEIKSLTALNQMSQNQQIKLVKGTLKLDSGLIIQEQASLIDAKSQSDVKINGTIYKNTLLIRSPLIYLDQSVFNAKSFEIMNMTTSNPILRQQSYSISTYDGLKVHNFSGPLLSSKNSDLTLLNSDITDIEHMSQVQSILTLQNTLFTGNNLTFSDIRSASNIKTPIISVRDSSTLINGFKASQFSVNLISFSNVEVQIANAHISEASNANSQGLALYLSQSNLRIDNSTFSHLDSQRGAAIFITHPKESAFRKQLNIQNSTFQQNSASLQGGAIYAINVDFTSSGSKYTQNTANERGGSIFLSCSIDNVKKCTYAVGNNSFERDRSTVSGGSLFYDLYSPVGLLSNNFTENQAPYGPNYASYSYQLKVINEDMSWANRLVSGGDLPTFILVGVFDQNDQLISTDNNSSGSLSSEDLSLQMSGNTKVIAQQGVYNFTNIQILAQPDYTTSIRFTSTSIDEKIFSTINPTGDTYLDLPIIFRQCVSGEVTYDSRCKICPRGYYSFDPTSSECKICLESSTCLGGDQILLDAGYWRSGNQSEIVYSCFAEGSCLQISMLIIRGGANSECGVGYQGKLCGICLEEVDGALYSRQGAIECGECLSLGVQFLQLFGVLIMLLLYVAYIVQSLLKNAKRNKPQTVLIRILTNYFQVVMLVKDFELKWPPAVQEVLQYFSIASSSQERLFSFECIYKQLGVELSSSFYIKVIMFGLLPLALSFLGLVFWLIVKFTWKRKSVDFKLGTNILVTTFAFIFICYPQITSISFSLFNCVSFEDGKEYLKRDMNIQCWEGDHMRMALAIGMPFILIWSFIFPLLILWRLKKGKKFLNTPHYLMVYGLFYVGLSDQAYFWELIIALIGIAILFAQNQYANHKEPYLDPRFNSIDFHATYAAVAALFGGLFFLETDVQNNDSFLTGLFVVILVYNIAFISIWVYNFLNVLIRIHQPKIQKVACLKFLHLADYEKDLKDKSEKYKRSKSSRRNTDSKSFASQKNGDNNVSHLNLLESYVMNKNPDITHNEPGTDSRINISNVAESDRAQSRSRSKSKKSKKQPLDNLSLNNNADQADYAQLPQPTIVYTSQNLNPSSISARNNMSSNRSVAASSRRQLMKDDILKGAQELDQSQDHSRIEGDSMAYEDKPMVRKKKKDKKSKKAKKTKNVEADPVSD